MSMVGMLSAALGYTARGWIVHRIHPPTAHVKAPGKQPMDTGWQEVTEPPTKDTLEQWFENDKTYNIGLRCGEASGVTVIDLDRAIYADIFSGVNTLRSSRTTGRGHVFFSFNPNLPSSKHHNLGIEVLSESRTPGRGTNIILPPSTHATGDVYHWDDPAAPLADMPEEVEVKLTNLFEREKGLNRLIKKCRPCFTKLWKKESRELTDFHGGEGRELMVAWGADLKAAGATLADAEMWSKIIYGEDHDPAKTLTEWRNIDPGRTWKCTTIAEKLGTVITCDCDTCAYKPPTPPRQQAPVAAPAPAAPETPPSAGVDALSVMGGMLDRKLDAIDIAESLQKTNPIIYDKTRQFWVWDDMHTMYHPIDETDVFNALRKVAGLRGGVVGSSRSAYLQAIKLTGRELEVKEPEDGWIAFADCVIDYRTGKRFKASKEYLFVNTIPHKYGESTDTPTIDRLFTEWVGADWSEMLYEITAYCILNSYPIHRVFLLLGSGRNGKGQFLNFVQRFLGHENTVSTDFERLMDGRFETVRLYRKKAAIMGETNFKEISKTAMFKQLSGGDLVPGERKYGTPFDFINHAKLLIGSNSIPASDDKSEGFGSRWIIIDFPNKFEVSRPVIDQIPEWEYENLCRKSIGKLRCLLERGAFCEEGDTSARTRRYEEKSNPIQRFIDISCYKGEDMSVPLWKFVEAYDVYQEQHRLRKLTKKAINRWLLDRGYETAQDTINDERGRHTWVIIYGLMIKPTCETCETCVVPPYTHEEKAAGNTHVSHVSHVKICGKCSKPLSGAVFKGPAGLGKICADCQAELDGQHGNGELTEDACNTLITAAISKIGCARGIKEFTPVTILMEMPKGMGMTTENIELFMIAHVADLKIERIDGGRWRQVSS